jgi:peptidylprolyl isomerase
MALEKPEVDFPTGDKPTELVIRDLVVGEGAEATPGATVLVHYGEPISFPLRGLIQGWQDGIPGMRVGGRRELTIPPALAYGERGMHRLSGKTLIFVIDLLRVG